MAQSSPGRPTDFDRVGGESGLRRIIDDFVARVFDDVMIGFFFRRVSRARIAEMEYQHAAAHLGGGVSYTGRDLGRAHARHPIMGGHFDRRLQILRNTLSDHQVPADVQERWLVYTELLRGEITGDAPGQCNDAVATRRVRRNV